MTDSTLTILDYFPIVFVLWPGIVYGRVTAGVDAKESHAAHSDHNSQQRKQMMHLFQSFFGTYLPIIIIHFLTDALRNVHRPERLLAFFGATKSLLLARRPANF